MGALHARAKGAPLPAGMVLISPWLDLTLKDTVDSPAISTDFLMNFKTANPVIVDTLLPADIKPEDPRVSPVFDNLESLPPQLVFAGTAEVLLPDSETWVRRSREAGNEVDYVRGKGEMHTYVYLFKGCVLGSR